MDREQIVEAHVASTFRADLIEGVESLVVPLDQSPLPGA